MIAKEKSPKGIKKPILVKLPFLLLIPLGLWLPSLASMHPLTVERLYSRGIYPYISRAASRRCSAFLSRSFSCILLYSVCS